KPSPPKGGTPNVWSSTFRRLDSGALIADEIALPRPGLNCPETPRSSVFLGRFVTAHNYEPAFFVIRVATQDGHLFADRLMRAARQLPVVVEPDSRVGRVEQ